MKALCFNCIFVLLIIASCRPSRNEIRQVDPKESYDAGALPRDERMKWWDEARFGMFIHWGLYAVPGGIWEGREVEELGEWIQAYADIPDEDYTELADLFNPVEFNAKEWVKLAKEAGMKYIVITTRHHDGFCLFETKQTDWDVIDASPFGRDIIKELSSACNEAGMQFGAYYSILEWKHHAMELNMDFSDLDEFSDHALEGGGFTNVDTAWRKYGNVKVIKEKKSEFVNYMKAQLKEIIGQYEPDLIWFDGGWVDWWTPDDGKDLLRYLWELDSSLVVNNRAAEDFDQDRWYGDYGTPEQVIPMEGLDYRWESCMTMNNTWGYKSYDENWKPPALLITQLVDIVSKGGNFLLNVGPSPEGLIPGGSRKGLKEIGEWIKVNGESIYGTEMWKVYNEGNVEMREEIYDGKRMENLELPFTAKDIRFTKKINVLYATCLGWPENELIIKALGTRKSPEISIENISMLGSGEEISWDRTSKRLRLSVPSTKPCKYAYVYKIEFEK